VKGSCACASTGSKAAGLIAAWIACPSAATSITTLRVLSGTPADQLRQPCHLPCRSKVRQCEIRRPGSRSEQQGNDLGFAIELRVQFVCQPSLSRLDRAIASCRASAPWAEIKNAEARVCGRDGTRPAESSGPKNSLIPVPLDRNGAQMERDQRAAGLVRRDPDPPCCLATALPALPRQTARADRRSTPLFKREGVKGAGDDDERAIRNMDPQGLVQRAGVRKSNSPFRSSSVS